MPNPPPGFEWDEAKAQWNLRVHGISFAAVRNFQFETAILTEDTRADYGEERIFALGKIGRTIHALVFTRRKDKRRIITLRKATVQERATYFAAGGQ
ncbi:MAG: BrnT family toxin [Hyphomonadaceae bacterium]